MKPKIERNTPEEEAAIQRGIEQDPDTFEADGDWFRRAKPAREVLRPEVYDALVKRQQGPRGPGKKPAKRA